MQSVQNNFKNDISHCVIFEWVFNGESDPKSIPIWAGDCNVDLILSHNWPYVFGVRLCATGFASCGFRG